MTLFGRYMFRQVANAFIVILLTLDVVVWLATALKELNLITSHGQGILLFLQMTLLSLPSLDGAHRAERDADGRALHARPHERRQRVDRDDGLRRHRLAHRRAAARDGRLSCPFGILVANLFLTPASMRALRDFVTQVRADLISQVLQPGRFSSPESGLTFHIRDRSLNGDLLGLLVHDERDDKQVMSYLAERGRIITNDEGSYLVMFDGYVHRYNSEDKNQNVQIVAFDQNMLDLSEFAPKDTTGNDVRPREMYFSDLLSPDMNDKAVQRNYGQIRGELHDRLATPLYPLAFAFIAIALLAHPRTTRESRWGQILTAFGIALGLEDCRTHVGQSADHQPVGGRACVWNSAGDDSRCGMDGAR